jgi:hypothetical protein
LHPKDKDFWINYINQYLNIKGDEYKDTLINEVAAAAQLQQQVPCCRFPAAAKLLQFPEALVLEMVQLGLAATKR